MPLEGTRPRPFPTPIAPRPAPPPTAAPQAGSSRSSGSGGASGAAPDASGSGLSEAGRGLRDAANIRDGINRLNGDGDSAYLRVSPELKGQGNVRIFKLGAKAQLGADMRVTRNGEGANATYTLRYDQQGLGALMGEVGTDKLGRNGKGGIPGAKLKAEIGGQSFDAVEMTFATKDEAIRAAETIQRLHLANAISDGLHMATSGTPLGGPLASLSGAGANPLANPLNADGQPGRLAQRIAGVGEADLAFLKDHVTAYETTIGSRGRLAAELKGDMKYFDIAAEGRLDDTRRISRRVELPTADHDGSVTYAIEGGLRLTAKEKAQKGFDMAGLPVEAKLDNRTDLGNASLRVALHYTLPKGEDVTSSAGGRPFPEADGRMQLDAITLGTTVEYRSQPMLDPSRWDSQRISSTLRIDQPERLDEAAGRFFDGDFRGAARAAGAGVELRTHDIARSGTNTQTGIKLDLGVGDAEATLIVEAGMDDVRNTRRVAIAAGADPAPAKPGPAVPGPQGPGPTTAPTTAPAPRDDGHTLVVTPGQGAWLREEPQGKAVTALPNGDFLRDLGDRRKDAAGQDWIRVSAQGHGRAPVQGWVRADLVAAHSSATGAMGPDGRINPTLEYQRHDAVTVAQDGNLWDIAQQHGVDPQQTVTLNADHLANPSLVFKGDTVYLPGTARGPARRQPETGPGRPARPEPARPEPGARDPAPPAAGPSSPTASGRGPAEAGRSTPRRAEPGHPPPPAPSTTPAAAPAARSGAPATAAPRPPAPPATTPDAGPRPDPAAILDRYQVRDDSLVEYHPQFGPLPIDIPRVPGQRMTATEAGLLDQLGRNRGLAGLYEFQRISSSSRNDPGLAHRTADRYFPQIDAQGRAIRGGDDGHNDAFRHAYWSALMTRHFGENFAASFATAHEGVPGNPAAREAMDLYNNEIGRRIATEHPAASDEDLARLVHDAVMKGQMIVIDPNGNLAFSSQVRVGQTGEARPNTLPGRMVPPDYSSSRDDRPRQAQR